MAIAFSLIVVGELCQDFVSVVEDIFGSTIIIEKVLQKLEII